MDSILLQVTALLESCSPITLVGAGVVVASLLLYLFLSIPELLVIAGTAATYAGVAMWSRMVGW